MAILRYIFIVIVCFPITHLYAAIPNHNTPLKNIKYYKNEIAKNKNENLKFKNEINTFEKKLNSINNKYIKLLNLKSRFDQKIIKLKSENQNITAKLDNFTLVLNKLKLRYLLDRSDTDEDSAATLLINNRYNKMFNELKIKKRSIANSLFKINSRIKLEQSRLSKILSKIVLFEDLSREWENNKAIKVNNYLNNNKLIASYKGKIKIIKRNRFKKSKKLSSLKNLFNWPIKKYVGINFKKKGVTFSFDKRLDVKAGKNGKVSHVGKLSTYGTIVIIKHKNNYRSIYLGNFIAQIKKGQNIIQGDIIGMSDPSGVNQLGKLYYEIRKNNKSVNTINLLKKKI